MIRRRPLPLAIALLAAIAIAPADASFPGQNGKLAIERGRDVWTINPDGSGATQLTTGGGTLAPTVSADGGQIAFSRGGDIWVMNSDGSGARNVTGALGSTDNSPTWSPDGARIAFSRGIPGSPFRIWVVNADGSNPVQLTGLANASSGDFAPAWSPNGAQIAYTRANNSSDIWTVTVANPGSEVEYVNSPQRTEDQATWAPDGSAIAFTTNRGTGNDIYMQAGPGGPGSPVTSNPSDDNEPSWSPDGTRIAFASTRGGGTQVWSVGVQPGATEVSPTNLSLSAATDSQPDWGPLQAVPPTTPPPVIGETVNAAAVNGTVTYKLPRSATATGRATAAQSGFLPLTATTRSLPIGTTFDTKKGTVRLTFAASKSTSKTQTGTFRYGRFVTKQSSSNPLTELKLAGSGLNKCNTKRPKGGAARAARKRSRRLFSSGKGRFRTRGRHSTATVRGTKWLTKDTCAGTLTVVRQGSVRVRDLRKRKTVTVRKGHRYFASAAPLR